MPLLRLQKRNYHCYLSHKIKLHKLNPHKSVMYTHTYLYYDYDYHWKCHDKTIHLVMDLYAAHMTNDVYKLALNFYRKVFGSLKAKASKLFRKRNHLGQPLKAFKLDACQDMCRVDNHTSKRGVSFIFFMLFGKFRKNRNRILKNAFLIYEI